MEFCHESVVAPSPTPRCSTATEVVGIFPAVAGEIAGASRVAASPLAAATAKSPRATHRPSPFVAKGCAPSASPLVRPASPMASALDGLFSSLPR
jgi:hypothetical protein